MLDADVDHALHVGGDPLDDPMDQHTVDVERERPEEVERDMLATEITKAAEAASDHAAIWADVDV